VNEPLEPIGGRARLSGVAKAWILDTETKGTGAHIAPLKGDSPRDERELATVVFERPPRRVETPEPAPRAFKVVDVRSARVLAEGADTRETLELLANMSSVVDARVYVWAPANERWRLLTLAEQKTLWELRGRVAPSTERGPSPPKQIVA
jgi:hypothetical protein